MFEYVEYLLIFMAPLSVARACRLGENQVSKIADVHKQSVQRVDLINDTRLCTTMDSLGGHEQRKV